MTDRVDIPDEQMRVLRILAGAIVAGAVVFAVVAAAVVHVGMQNPQPSGQFISLILALLSLGQIVPQWFMMQRVSAGSVPRGGDPHSQENLLGRYRGAMIIRFALLEGAAFMNIVAYLVEHNWWSMAIVGGLVLLMLGLFPTRTKVEHWIETQQMLSQTQR